MKKYFGQMLFLAAAAAVLLLASCQRDELQGGSISGEEVSVSISATMPIDGGAVVKSNDEPGNASEVNRCIMGVYLNDDGMSQPEPMGDKVVVRVDGTTHKAEFGDLQLVSGHKYLLVFWADNAAGDSDNGFEDNHYNTAGFPEVTFKEGDTYQSNDDTRDAFFASYPIEVNGPSSHDINLHRPFGQLNITTNDYRTVAEDFKSLLPTQVKIDFSGIPSGIDLLTGKLTENKIESLTSGPVPIAVVTSPIAADGCRQLSFDYIFAPYEEEGEEQQLVLNEFKMHFLSSGGQETISAYTFQNIPVRRNYRTNVSGNLLTDRTGVEIEVVPDFDGTHGWIEAEAEVGTAEELVAVFAKGGNVKLTASITLGNSYLINQDVEVNIDLNQQTLTSSGALIASDGGVLTIMNGTVATAESYGSTNYIVSADAGGEVILDKVKVQSKGAGVGFMPSAGPSKLTVRNSEITAFSFGIGTNAGVAQTGSEMVIENSTIDAYAAVLFNLDCELTIANSTLNGGNQGLIARGGDIEVTDSRIFINYPDGDLAQIDSCQYLNEDWKDGNKVPMAAIVAGNRGSGYQYPTKLALNNTEVASIGKEARYFPALYVWANQEKENGVTITYDEDTKFYGDRIYGNKGANITVNGAAAVSDDGDTRP